MKITSCHDLATSVHDPWICAYSEYLEHQHKQLNGGPIASHYLRCVEANYRAFQRSGSPADRFRAWVAIKATCEWLRQLREGAK